MQAIITKYHSPTNTRGARVSATCDSKRIFVSYPHELSGEKLHAYALKELCRAMGGKCWEGQYIGGDLPGNQGMVWVSAFKYAPRVKVKVKE